MAGDGSGVEAAGTRDSDGLGVGFRLPVERAILDRRPAPGRQFYGLRGGSWPCSWKE